MAEPWSAREVVVVVPAHDEAAGIGATLRSVDAARRRLPTGVLGRVVVVSDASADGTAEVAAAALGADDAVVTIDARCVGRARRVGAAVGLALAGGSDGVWIASTDADTIVPEHWLNAQLVHAGRGVVGVAGVVRLRADERVDDVAHDTLVHRFERHYAPGCDGHRHGHVHGANLGVRADAYVRCGGWHPLPTAEDHDLWRRLVAGGPVVSTTGLVVATSARRVGRAPRGFAAGLDELTAAVA